MYHKRIVIAATEISTGGLGSYLMTLVRGLKSRGWSVHLLATNERGDLFEHMRKSVTCYDRSALPLSVRKVLTAAELVNSKSPDILLLNNCSLMHYALPLIRTKTKPVAVLHSDDEQFYKTAAFFERKLFRWIAPTQGVADRCKSYLQPKQRQSVRTILHGINNEIFYSGEREAQRISGNICFIGFIAENKGADLLPDIFHKVINTHEDSRLTVVGKGPLKQRLQKIFSENGTLKKCIFAGSIKHEYVGKFLRNADIFLCPTRIEGFGLSVVEAMMSGAVPVVSRIKGVTDDIVDDGVNGLLVEPDDTEGFADAIICLLNSPEKLISMSAAARETAVRRYSAERMIDAYEGLFAEDDDREKILCRGTLGWIIETMGEVINRGIDRKWLVRRALELWK